MGTPRIPRLPRAKQKRKLVGSRVRPSGLSILAQKLNSFAGPQDPPRDNTEALLNEAWRQAEEIVVMCCQSNFPEVKRLFNAMAERAIVYPAIELPFPVQDSHGEEFIVGREPINPILRRKDQLGEAVWYLWNFLFRNRGWERLKQCPVCHTWFVDITKNKVMARCSQTCTWKWWSRDRRKKEGHQQPGRKADRKGGSRHGTK